MCFQKVSVFPTLLADRSPPARFPGSDSGAARVHAANAVVPWLRQPQDSVWHVVSIGTIAHNSESDDRTKRCTRSRPLRVFELDDRSRGAGHRNRAGHLIQVGSWPAFKIPVNIGHIRSQLDPPEGCGKETMQ